MAVDSVMDAVRKQFTISSTQMKQIVDDFLVELKDGLEGRRSSFKMLPSFITELPTGKENGSYYGIDMGGTNFRAVKFNFDGSNNSSIVAEKKSKIPDNVRVTEHGEHLFDFFAETIRSLPDGDLASNEEHLCGFTFSFPVLQKSLNHGELIRWTKGFDAKGVEGNDVVGLLQEALERSKTGSDPHLTVNVLINDTVGTLAAGRYEKPTCVMGLILGTGTNVAYVEKSANITKLPAAERDSENMVINVEWGAFGDIRPTLPLSDADIELDKNSKNIGEQHFEKMVSGFYLGEIVRLILVSLQAKGEIFSEEGIPPQLLKQHTLDTSILGNVENLDNPVAVSEIKNALHSQTLSQDDLNVFSEVCGLVVDRSALFAACGISALLTKMGLKDVFDFIPSIAIDGSLFECHPSYSKRLYHYLDILGTKCELFLAKDGSGKGAALLASVKY